MPGPNGFGPLRPLRGLPGAEPEGPLALPEPERDRAGLVARWEPPWGDLRCESSGGDPRWDPVCDPPGGEPLGEPGPRFEPRPDWEPQLGEPWLEGPMTDWQILLILSCAN
jgi:hypothetical protein